jgi:fatty acid desaturase
MSSALDELPAQVGAPAANRAEIARLHEFEHWPARWVWPLFALLLTLQLAAVSLPASYWPLLMILLPAIGTVLFVFTLAFHDASHGRFHPVHWMNEMFGHIVGTLGFTPLHVYRYAHARHHAQLARQGDPELWPYNSPAVPRPLRVAAALAEIGLGAVYTPLLFLRSVIVGKLLPRERTLIVRGYVACFAFWLAVLVIANGYQLWRPLIVASLIPMVISGMLQTLNKFEQHLGLHGESVLGLTRTVVDRNRCTELVSAAMLYNDYHGTHHRYARIPYYHLPHATPFALAGAREHCPVYPNIVRALADMLRSLADPKAGPQWIERGQSANLKDSSSVWTVPIAQPVFTGEYDTAPETAGTQDGPPEDSPNFPPHRKVG